MDAPVWWSEFVLWLKSDVTLKKNALVTYHFFIISFFHNTFFGITDQRVSFSVAIVYKWVFVDVYCHSKRHFLFLCKIKVCFFQICHSFSQHNTIKAYIFNAEIIIWVSENCSGVNCSAPRKIAQAPSELVVRIRPLNKIWCHFPKKYSLMTYDSKHSMKSCY
jgi:hypothetical protein